MSSGKNTVENVRANIAPLLNSPTPQEKVIFYNTWAEKYDTDVAVLDYRSPSLVANMISTHFKGDRETAVVLDVACGTGLVAKQLNTHGFKHFVAIDGSKGMLEMARQTGLYQDLKQCLLGEEPLPVQLGVFDVVIIVGALCFGHIPVTMVRELYKTAKPGGYICITMNVNPTNEEYNPVLERELKQMEAEGMWTSVEVAHVKDWHKAVAEHEHGYISGVMYLFKKP